MSHRLGPRFSPVSLHWFRDVLPSSKIERVLRSTDSPRGAWSGLRLETSGTERTTEAISRLHRYESPAARRIAADVRALARNPRLAVLIEGETGTGKTLVARAIHDLSARAAHDYVRVDLAAVRPEFAESRLFGHFRGAFTGAVSESVGDFPRANRGSILLDEISKAELAVQQQLLGCIEYGQMRPMGCERWFTLDVRVIAATNVDLERSVDRGDFLPDLLARLQAGRMILPPLRARRADIPALVLDAVSSASRDIGRPRPPKIADELLAACLEYDWPTNLRELANTMQRAVTEAWDADTVRLSHVPDYLPLGRAFARRRQRIAPAELLSIYESCGRNPEETALRARVSLSTVFRHLQRFRASKGQALS